MSQPSHIVRLSICLLLPVVLGGTGYFVLKYRNRVESSRKSSESEHNPEWDLDLTLNAIDQADPAWRFEDLIKNRAEVPDDRNGSKLVLAAAKGLKEKDWPRQSLVDELMTVTAAELLTKKQSDDVVNELMRASDALGIARKLTEEGTGRYEFAWDRDFLSMDVSHLAQIQAVEQLLSFEALRLTQFGDIDGALRISCGILNSGRTLSDEPRADSCLIRMGAHQVAASAIERALAHGIATDAALADTQHLVENESSQNLLLLSARSERAGLHGLLHALEEKEVLRIDLDRTENEVHLSLKRILENKEFSKPERFKELHAWVLRYITEFIDIAKLPVEQHQPRLDKLRASRITAPPGAELTLVVPRVDAAERNAQYSQAVLRCTFTALAVERFRLAKGKWPESLDELVPAYLHTNPLNPYDGKPLRFKKLKEGGVVYCLGPNGRDVDGSFASLNALRPLMDVAFRLWDVDQRKKAAAP